jgi:hypothetical protein
MPGDDASNPLRDSFAIWEKFIAQYGDQVLRSPLFLRVLGQNLEISLGLQETAQQNLLALWRAWGLPTRADQELSLHKLNRLQSQVDQLTRRVDRLLDSPSLNQAARPGFKKKSASKERN